MRGRDQGAGPPAWWRCGAAATRGVRDRRRGGAGDDDVWPAEVCLRNRGKGAWAHGRRSRSRAGSWLRAQTPEQFEAKDLVERDGAAGRSRRMLLVQMATAGAGSEEVPPLLPEEVP
jgi:hypothetical protein